MNFEHPIAIQDLARQSVRVVLVLVAWMGVLYVLGNAWIVLDVPPSKIVNRS